MASRIQEMLMLKEQDMKVEKEKERFALLRGGKPDAKEFHELSIKEKLLAFHLFTSKQKLDLLLEDPEAEKLAQALPPQELYLMVKEVGEEEASPLLSLAAPEQVTFFLDMEIWNEWEMSQDKALEWLGLLFETGEKKAAQYLKQAENELLILIFMRELIVGGGIGDLLHDEERLTDWDQTFDDLFMIKYKNPAHTPLVSRLIDLIYRTDHPRYLALMEAVKGEVETELEDMCYKLRSDRLADLGFPPREEALAVYAPLSLASFSLSDKEQPVVREDGPNYPVTISGDSFLKRAIGKAGAGNLGQELQYLINTVLVADKVSMADSDAIDETVQRVHGYLNIALEQLAGADEDEGARILRQEYLQRLFRLGGTMVSEIRRRAAKIPKDEVSYATARALAGLTALRPRFYRGLDSDHADGFREFRDLADLEKTSRFLDGLEGR